MTYIVFKTPPEFHQISLDEFLFGADKIEQNIKTKDKTATRTYEFKNALKYSGLIDVQKLIMLLEAYNASTESLREAERHSLYYEFYIPKKSGGLRKIDAPNAHLMIALRNLKTIFETDCSGSHTILGDNHKTLALYHTSAFAYIEQRSTVDCIRKHQQNNSRWFAKFDFSNFFGSITKEYTMKMFSMIYPFSEIVRSERGRRALDTALELAFLDGVLPQGTPISPLITNIIMIPMDYKLSNTLRDFHWENSSGESKENKCVYTRYADDIIVSSEYHFNHKKVERFIDDVLCSFEAPFSLNEKKTRFGSRAGHNYALGVCLNNENNITIGYKKKKNLLAMVSSYAKDKKNGVKWSLNDVQVMDGNINYYRMIEKENAVNTIKHLSEKLGINIEAEIKKDLKGD